MATNLLGGIQLEEFKGLSSINNPDAQAAWLAVEGSGLTGAGYKPLLYCGTQVTKGMTYHFIAEQTFITAEPERHIVKLAVNKFNNEFRLVPQSIEVIY